MPLTKDEAVALIAIIVAFLIVVSIYALQDTSPLQIDWTNITEVRNMVEE